MCKITSEIVLHGAIEHTIEHFPILVSFSLNAECDKFFRLQKGKWTLV